MATILVVDDHQADRERLRTLLGDQDHRLIEAADGAEGLAVARAEHPDLIIADIVMPTMDGCEFVHQLRADPVIGHTAVIFYTAHYLEREARQLASSCNIAHIITKVAGPRRILEIVSAALSMATPSLPPTSGKDSDREPQLVATDEVPENVEDLRVASERMAALIDLHQHLASERDRIQLLNSTCLAARDIVGARHASVAVWDDSHQNHFLTSGIDPSLAARLTVSLPGERNLAALLTHAGSFRLSDLSGEPQRIGLPLDYPPVKSCLAASITSLTKVYGWLCLTDKLGAPEFSREDERLIQILAAQVGRLYENGNLYDDVQRRAAALEQEVLERRRTEEVVRRSEERFVKIFRSSPEAICMGTIEEGRFMDVNSRYLEFFGYERDEMIGHTADELGLWAIPADRPALISRLRSEGSVHNIEARFRRKSGELRDGLLSMERLQLGEEPVLIAMLSDITDRKRGEEEIRRLNAELEQRVADRTAQLATVNTELEVLNHGLQSFSYSVSHDLRAPLRAIDGFSRVLQEDYGTTLDETAQEHLRRVRAGVARMSQLIDDLLALARVTTGELQRQPVDLSELAGAIADGLRHGGPERQVEFVITPGLQAQADPHLARVALENLLGNAWKYTSKHSRARIEFGSTERDGQPAFFVRDDGAGFDMKFASELFGAFQRMHTVAEFEGSGVGLATVQRIIHRHGGRIWAEAAPERGATFYFTLPMLPQPSGVRSLAP